VDAEYVQLTDNTEHSAEIQRVGAAFAAGYLDLRSHFRGFLD